MGIGMRPDWTGSGKGTTITGAVMSFGIQKYFPLRLRATVAAWNERAQRVCLKNGFKIVDRFTNPKTYREFVILMKELV
jgi:ribosomal-protein-alanine N-acetyltransferase